MSQFLSHRIDLIHYIDCRWNTTVLLTNWGSIKKLTKDAMLIIWNIKYRFLYIWFYQFCSNQNTWRTKSNNKLKHISKKTNKADHIRSDFQSWWLFKHKWNRRGLKVNHILGLHLLVQSVLLVSDFVYRKLYSKTIKEPIFYSTWSIEAEQFPSSYPQGFSLGLCLNGMPDNLKSHGFLLDEFLHI